LLAQLRLDERNAAAADLAARGLSARVTALPQVEVLLTGKGRGTGHALSLGLGEAVGFGQAGEALRHLQKGGTAQIAEAFLAGSLGDLDRVAIIHDYS